MKLIGIYLLATGLVLAQAQEKSAKAADHSKQSDASAGKGQDGASKEAAKGRDRQHEKQHSDVKSPRDAATGQASGR